MKLSEIISLKINDKFQYKGSVAEVLYSKFRDEIAWEFRNGEIYRSKNFVMQFVLEDGSKIILSSSFPAPTMLNLPDYTCVK